MIFIFWKIGYVTNFQIAKNKLTSLNHLIYL
jgi:hypothetical protein